MAEWRLDGWSRSLTFWTVSTRQREQTRNGTSLQTLEACLWWHTFSDNATSPCPPQTVPPTVDRAQDYRGHLIQASTLTNAFSFSVTCPVSSLIYVFGKGGCLLFHQHRTNLNTILFLSPPGLWLPSTSIQKCWKLKGRSMLPFKTEHTGCCLSKAIGISLLSPPTVSFLYQAIAWSKISEFFFFSIKHSALMSGIKWQYGAFLKT